MGSILNMPSDGARVSYILRFDGLTNGRERLAPHRLKDGLQNFGCKRAMPAALLFRLGTRSHGIVPDRAGSSIIACQEESNEPPDDALSLTPIRLLD